MAANPAPYQDPGAVYQTLRWDPPTGGTVGVVTGTDSAILGGPIPPGGVGTHINNADDSVIIMGVTNTINIFSAGPPVVPGIYNIIGNGTNNVAAGDNATILNGNNNNVIGRNVEISNGDFNVIGPYSTLPVVVNSTFVSIGNGDQNVACGNYVSIMNGHLNSAFGHNSFMGSGENNIINLLQDFSFIGSGRDNTINGCTVAAPGTPPGSSYSFIGGGCENTIACSPTFPIPLINCGSPFSFIGGGCQNFIQTNDTDKSGFNFIGGGAQSTIMPKSNNTTIGGGLTNTASGESIFIGGGTQNHALGNFSVVTGGTGNVVNTGNSASFIGGGNQSNIDSPFSFIGGGCVNTITNGSQASTIAGGHLNTVQSSVVSFIGGGENNSIYNASCLSVIGGGERNQIANAGAGCCGAAFSFIGGGGSNCIDTNSTCVSAFNTIVGGCQNCIHPGAPGGHGDFIGGGFDNNVCGYANVLVGGCVNHIDSYFSFLGGGQNNCIDITAGVTGENVIAGGSYNKLCCATSYSGIGGGTQNMIKGGVASFIGGGVGNTITGNCSAILGGSGNSDGGFAYAGVFGQGVTAVMNSALHSNNFVSQNMPSGTCPGGVLTPPAGPAGMLWYFSPAVGICNVYIK